MTRKPGRCFYCGASIPAGAVTRDHVTPLALGGRSSQRNLVTACRPCNERKGAMTLEAYRAAHNRGMAFWGEANGRKRGRR